MSDAIKLAPWVGQLLHGESKSLCLYEIVTQALMARKTAIELAGDHRLIAKADAAINAIGSGKTRDNRTACRTASAALRKYVQSWGGSAAEADALT